MTVCSISGLLPTDNCDEGTTTLTYYEGTQPKRYCDLHQFKSEQAESTIRRLSDQRDVLGGGRVDATLNMEIPDLESLLRSLEATMSAREPQQEPEISESGSIYFPQNPLQPETSSAPVILLPALPVTDDKEDSSEILD